MASQQGQVVFITGAASPIGIGRATALAFAQQGARLVLTDVDEANLHDTARLCSEAGTEALPVRADVSRTDEVQAAVAAGLECFGQIDALVANAGIARRKRFVDLTDDDVAEVMETNFGGAWRCARAVLPGMLERGAGCIVSVSSLMGSPWGWTEHVPYSASKAAIEGMTRALANELGPRGIRVNAVSPGFIRTNQSLDSVNSGGEEGMRESVGYVPLRRIGNPEDIADVIVFVCSPAARYLTGQVLLIDGGITLGDLSPAQIWPSASTLDRAR